MQEHILCSAKSIFHSSKLTLRLLYPNTNSVESHPDQGQNDRQTGKVKKMVQILDEHFWKIRTIQIEHHTKLSSKSDHQKQSYGIFKLL